MNNITEISRWVSLLIVGLGLAIAPKANASLQFNGSNSKAVLDSSYLDASTHSSYTFEVWIKPFSLGGTLIGKMEYWKAWTLDTTSDGGMLLTGSWPNYYWGTKVAGGSLTTNVWQHVCCAVTGGQASFYVNGVLVGTETVQNPISFNASTNIGMMPPYGCDGVMSIGYTDSGTTPDYNFFNGLISGIKVWNRTLSASEVAAIATTGVPLTTNGLYNAVMLNEGAGTMIHDSLSSLTGRALSAQWSSDNPTFPSGFLTNGLVAYYPFNSNANDASGHGHDGINHGGVLASDRFGNPNQAYRFDGTNNSSTNFWVDLSQNRPLTGVHNFSICGWIKPRYIPSGEGPGAVSGAEYPARGIYMHEGNIGSYVEIGVRINVSPWTSASMRTLEFITINGYPGKPSDNFFANQPIPTNTWTAFAATYDGVTKTLYINGTANVAEPYTFVPDWDTHFFGEGFGEGIGGNFAGQAESFDGVIDDVRIYNRALTSNEVAELYAVESTPPSPPCSPHKATATVQMDNGFVVGATITDPGCGYTNAPAVLIQGGGGSGATAVAVVSNGVVVKIIITDAGFGYTSVPSIAITSPPFVPMVSIAVSKVKVTQYVVLGRTYVLEASTDLVTWTATGPQFTAQAETVVNEFDVDVTGRYFRIRQVP